MNRFLALFLVLCVGLTANAQTLSYAEARSIAISSELPLVILAESTTCPPCKEFWSETLQPMLESGELSQCVFVRVNMNDQPELIETLSITATPSLVVYHYHSGHWEKERRVIGKVGKAVVRTLTSPVRLARKTVAKVADNYRARWENYDGLSFEAHARVMHGIDTTGMTHAEIGMARDHDHDRYGGGHPAAMRSRSSGVVAVGSSCPPGGCPTATVRRGLFFRR